MEAKISVELGCTLDIRQVSWSRTVKQQRWSEVVPWHRVHVSLSCVRARRSLLCDWTSFASRDESTQRSVDAAGVLTGSDVVTD